MTPISSAQLRQIMPAAGYQANVYAGALDAAMARFSIDTPRRAAAFLAQIAVESAQLICVEERLNYSAAALHSTWPAHFDLTTAGDYAHQPERIANRAYANRLGNGDEASGDGWRYRGRGLLQITGRDNYAACGDGIGYYLDRSPFLLLQPDTAALSAAWYWSSRRLNELADVNDFDGISDIINRGHKTVRQGDANGFADREQFWEVAKRVLAENCETEELV